MNDDVLNRVKFVDFYRYCDVELDEVLSYLHDRVPWLRPEDTGRSTNCLINEAGIHVHKTERGYHNYALPYSWDVRLGHKERDAAVAELCDGIDVARVSEILDEIGYDIGSGPSAQTAHRRLAAWYVAGQPTSAEELREWLASKLPAEYLPSSFVALDTLPVTPNDKVDRAALPRPGDARTTASTAYVAPSGATERVLAEIWADVLGVERVGVDDDFFDLGGDSILNIQIVTRARARRVVITPQQIFERPTVAGLAQVAQTGGPSLAPQGPIEGEVRLTPIQQRFLAEFSGDRNRFSQDALLELRTRFDRATLEAALALLLARHDTLRSQFARDDDGRWMQIIQAVDAVSVELDDADLTGIAVENQAQAIEQLTAELSTRLDIATGACVAAAHVRRGDGRDDQLLMVIHHLVVDGVSWWVLARDLEAALPALAAGRAPTLGPRSSSWRQWGEALDDYARSPALRRESAYWTERVPPSMTLPCAVPGSCLGLETVRVELDRDRTSRLLHEAPGALRAQVPELLVTALHEAMADTTRGDTLRLDIEAHGREEIAAGLDLLRTVGWFTSIFPVTLRREPNGGPLATLRAVKERLRAVPNRGVGYGVLRYSAAGSDTAHALGAQPHSPAVFNYMGRWDRATATGGALGFARPIGLQWSGDAPWLTPLEIDAVVFDASLVVDFRHGVGGPAAPAVRSLADRFLAVVAELVDAGQSDAGTALAPSDFPNADLDQSGLDDILSDLGEGD